MTKEVDVIMKGVEGEEGSSDEDISDSNYINLHDIVKFN